MSKKFALSIETLYNKYAGGKTMIFVPIFKTKQNAERCAIAKIKPLLSESIIPLLQIIKKVDNQNFAVMANSIENNKFFFEIFGKNTKDYTNLTIKIAKKYGDSIPLFELSKIDSLVDFNNFVLNRENGKSVSIKIKIGQINLISMNEIKLLKPTDYLFVDIEDSDYSSLHDEFNQIKFFCKAKIIVITHERKDNIAGKYYKNYSYNRAYFISTVIESIKNNDFLEDGFASYCTAKNNEEETGGNGDPLTGVFLTYVYSENAVYSVISPKKDVISRVYTQIRELLKKESPYNDAFNSLYSNTPISMQRLQIEYKKDKHSRAVDFIEVSIIHYIEEIVNNLFN